MDAIHIKMYKNRHHGLKYCIQAQFQN